MWGIADWQWVGNDRWQTILKCCGVTKDCWQDTMNYSWRIICDRWNILHLYQTKLDSRANFISKGKRLHSESLQVYSFATGHHPDRKALTYKGQEKNRQDGILQSTLCLYCILVQVVRETEVQQEMLGCFIPIGVREQWNKYFSRTSFLHCDELSIYMGYDFLSLFNSLVTNYKYHLSYSYAIQMYTGKGKLLFLLVVTNKEREQRRKTYSNTVYQ